MKKITVGILAHVDSGKTTLCEALLYCSGNLRQLGRVDHRDSFLDNFSLERERGITIFSKQAVLRYGGTEITLLDTPGHVDFSAETERTLGVLDYAILVVSATDGVQSHTATLWKLLERYNVPCFLFINKMDLPNADREAVTEQLKEKLSGNCVDFGEKNGDTLLENIALCAEELLSEYMETGGIAEKTIADAIRQRKLFPCLFGSALKLDGIADFLALFDRFTEQTVYGEDFSAKVFKISRDAQGNRLTHLKITGGTLRIRETLPGAANTDEEKVNQIRIYSGEKFTAVDAAEAGTICAVTGVSFTRPGDGLGAETDAAIPVLQPVLNYALLLPEGVDTHTALEKMRILEAEDPQLHVTWNERLREIRIQLMGDIQLEVLQSLIRERFGMEVGFGQGSVVYKETVTDVVEGVGHFEPLRHYAEVHLILKPLKRGAGLVFKSKCSEDKLDRNWQRLILTHLQEKTHLGVLTGSPITDMEITLASGRAHPKHTEGGDFRQATYRAVRQGLRSANSILLEPVFSFTLEIPSANTGRALADIQRMGGSFQPPEQDPETTVITGVVPAATMRGYAKEVVRYTHGKGRLSCALKGYEPCRNAEEIITEIGYDPDNDAENPCDSVFCSHGAGHTVKWNEVSEHMHLPSALSAKKPEQPLRDRKSYFSQCRTQKDIFALDKELMQIFEQTYGPLKKRTPPPERKHFSAPESKTRAYKFTPVFEGPEYVLIDGYNVIFSWEHLSRLAKENIDAARSSLINTLCNFQGYRKCELILVFDAYRVKGSDREVEKISNISVVYTKEAETADTYIEKTSHDLAKKHRVRVVTSDLLEQLIILGNGAIRVSSREFLEEVRQAEEEIRAIISQEQ